MLSRLSGYAVGPRLYRHQDTPYASNRLEALADFLFTLGVGVRNFCLVTSPLLLPYVLLRHTPNYNGCAAALRYVVIFYSIAYSLRILGRLSSSEYRTFIGLLENVKASAGGAGQASSTLLKRLKTYDYQCFDAPVDFKAARRSDRWFAPKGTDEVLRPLAEPWNTLREAAAYAATHTFGRRMLFPGAVALMKYLLNGELLNGRNKAYALKHTQRNLLQTENGDLIDSMFWDRRGEVDNAEGNTLVICCEGNAGFWETGVTVTPLKLNYSVLGWNMPGFGESSGAPHPPAILHSMEAVMQFAIERLGFAPPQIVIYGWSIGGYPATWAAANYPDIRALILDASFDDLVPLATTRMPKLWESIVHYAIRTHLDLPIAKQLAQYKGPLRLIRRWNDEIIITDNEANEEGRRASNRANYLLLDTLRSRYPGLMQDGEEGEQCVWEWLGLDAMERIQRFEPEEPVIPAGGVEALRAMNTESRHRLIRNLCSKLFLDAVATHNVPLSPHYFDIPTPIKKEGV